MDKLEGRALIGVVNSLSLVQDAASRRSDQCLDREPRRGGRLGRLAGMGNFGSDSAARFLIQRLRMADKAFAALESAAVRTAILLESAGKRDKAMEIYRLLADARRSPGARHAGFLAVLAACPEGEKAAIIAQWSKSPDVSQQKAVIAQLTALSDAALEQVSRHKGMGEKVQIALMEELAARQGEKMLPAMLEAANSGDPAKVQMALRFLASVGDPQVIPVLIKALNSDEATRTIAAAALAQRPKQVVGPALLEALTKQVDVREQIVDILSTLKYYEAIDPLTTLAQCRPGGLRRSGRGTARDLRSR